MDLLDILWCKNCRKFARVEGELNRQGLSNVCVECGANVDVIPYSEVKNTAYDGSIKVPSDKVWLKWMDSQPKGIYTCSGCGKEDREYLVQPQHPAFVNGIEGIALCNNCVAEHARQRREQRKKEIDAMPRCEVPGCKHRGTWAVAGHTMLCGWHLRNVQKLHRKTMAQMGFWGVLCFEGYSKSEILRMAVMK